MEELNLAPFKDLLNKYDYGVKFSNTIEGENYRLLLPERKLQPAYPQSIHSFLIYNNSFWFDKNELNCPSYARRLAMYYMVERECTKRKYSMIMVDFIKNDKPVECLFDVVTELKGKDNDKEADLSNIFGEINEDEEDLIIKLRDEAIKYNVEEGFDFLLDLYLEG